MCVSSLLFVIFILGYEGAAKVWRWSSLGVISVSVCVSAGTRAHTYKSEFKVLFILILYRLNPLSFLVMYVFFVCFKQETPNYAKLTEALTKHSWNGLDFILVKYQPIAHCKCNSMLF